MKKRSFSAISLKKTFNVTDVVTILSYELSPNFFTTGESHDFWEMLYIDRGRIKSQSGERNFVLSPGELIFHKPNDFHVVKCDGGGSASVFIISFVCKSPAMNFLGSKVMKAGKYHTEVIRKLIDEANLGFQKSTYPLEPLSTAPAGVCQMIKNKLEELLILFVREAQPNLEQKRTNSGRFTSESALAGAIADCLKENLTGKVKLEDLSGRLHYGKSTLCDVFKRAYGKTIIEYHTELKIEEAKRMIFELKIPVGEIAERLGFESPEYFSRTFRKYVGMSPRAFRSSLMGTNTVYLENEVKLKV